MGDLAIGTIVRRNCKNTIGHNSIGRIYQVSDTCYWVEIIVGKNRMEGWSTDAWSKNWCVPEALTPSWEV
jgi:hypothetical protein